jgi:excisionase family DNA binding protein
VRTPTLVDVFLAELDGAALDTLAERLAPRIARALGPTEHEMPPWLNAEDAARYLACSRDRLYDLVQLQKLEPRRDGRRLLFRRADLDAYLEGT